MNQSMMLSDKRGLKGDFMNRRVGMAANMRDPKKGSFMNR